jgi:hypothetical protein
MAIQNGIFLCNTWKYDCVSYAYLLEGIFADFSSVFSFSKMKHASSIPLFTYVCSNETHIYAVTRHSRGANSKRV